MTDKTISSEKQTNQNGEVRIANDVISVIAGMALCEIPGIYIDNRLPEAFIDRSNAKNITKAIKIEIVEGQVAVSIIISIEYGKSISDLCCEVQDKIKCAVQTMTGLSVLRVDVTVADWIFKKEQKGESKK